MTTDALTETVVEEAEAIVRAEWMRLQHDDALDEHAHRAVCSEMPAARPRSFRPVIRTATGKRSGAPRRRPGWPPRSGPHRRVWPTQRSPPLSPGVVPNDCRTRWNRR
jgi:hypothetical protein